MNNSVSHEPITRQTRHNMRHFDRNKHIKKRINRRHQLIRLRPLNTTINGRQRRLQVSQGRLFRTFSQHPHTISNLTRRRRNSQPSSRQAYKGTLPWHLFRFNRRLTKIRHRHNQQPSLKCRMIMINIRPLHRLRQHSLINTPHHNRVTIRPIKGQTRSKQRHTRRRHNVRRLIMMKRNIRQRQIRANHNRNQPNITTWHNNSNLRLKSTNASNPMTFNNTLRFTTQTSTQKTNSNYNGKLAACELNRILSFSQQIIRHPQAHDQSS